MVTTLPATDAKSSAGPVGHVPIWVTITHSARQPGSYVDLMSDDQRPMRGVDMKHYFTKAERQLWLATWHVTIAEWQKSLRQERV
jgi:hypothetical protein